MHLTELNEKLNSLHRRRNQALTDDDMEFIEFLNNVDDNKTRKIVNNNILSNAPKNVKPGTIGEALYICTKNLVDNDQLPVPECFETSYVPSPHLSIDKNVYKRSDDELKRIYKHTKSNDAYIFMISQADTNLTTAERNKLSNDGIETAFIYHRQEESVNYEKIREVNIKKSWEDLDSTGYDKTNTKTCKTRKPDCDDKDNNSSSGYFWIIFLVLFLIFIFIIIACFAYKYYGSSLSVTSSGTSSLVVTPVAMTAPGKTPHYNLNEKDYFSSDCGTA